MRDGQRQGVGGVRRTRRGVEPEDLGDQLGDGVLVGGPAAGHGGLDLRGGVQRHGDSPARGGGNHHAGGLGNAHHRADVELGEDAFDGEDLRLVLVQPLIDRGGDDQQALVQAFLRGGADDAEGHHGGAAVLFDVHDADPAAGEARIDAEDAKGHSASSAACTSSLRSALLYTFWTSSSSSRASTSFMNFLAASRSSGTCMDGTNSASSVSYSMPASLRASRMAWRSVGSEWISKLSPLSLTSSAPASSTAISTSSSVRPFFGSDTTPLRLKR